MEFESDIQPVFALNRRQKGPVDPGCSCAILAVLAILGVGFIGLWIDNAFFRPIRVKQDQAARLKAAYQGKPTLIFCSASSFEKVQGCGAVYRIQPEEIENEDAAGCCKKCGKWISWTWWGSDRVEDLMSFEELDAKLHDPEGLHKRKWQTLRRLQEPDMTKVNQELREYDPEDNWRQHYDLGDPVLILNYRFEE